MRNMKLFFGALTGLIVVVVAVSIFFSRAANAPVDMKRILGTTQNATGSAQAKVTIVEFSDFQCPACRVGHAVVKDLIQAYPNDIRLIYRHFPLTTIHKNAMGAARAAEITAQDGKFWQYYDLLFERQHDWEGKTEKEVADLFVTYAQEVGVSKTVAQTMKEKLKQDNAVITADIADATVIGIDATPTFYVNGVKVSVSELQKTVIDAMDW